MNYNKLATSLIAIKDNKLAMALAVIEAFLTNYDDTKDANKLAINTAIKEALSDTNMSIDFAKFISHLSFNSTRIVKEDVICVIEAYTCNDNGDYQDTTVVGKMIQTLLPLSPLLVNVLQTAEDALSA